MTLIDRVNMMAKREEIEEQLNKARREGNQGEMKRLQTLIEPVSPLPEPSLPEHLAP